MIVSVWRQYMDEATRVRINWKIARNQCCQCSREADGDLQLCKYHTNKRKHELTKLSPAEREVRNEIDRANGKIGPSRRGRKPKDNAKRFV